MTRRERRRIRAISRSGQGSVPIPQAIAQTRHPINFGLADRRALLLGTALVSTLLLGTMAAPAPAAAVQTCAADVGSGLPISHAVGDEIICVNTEPRINAGGTAIYLSTGGADHDLYLNNSGKLTAGDFGIRTRTDGDGSAITIINSGDITVSSVSNHYGIFAQTSWYGIARPNSPIAITNSGNLVVTTSVGDAAGIFARTGTPGYLPVPAPYSPITINNYGVISATATGGNAAGMFAQTYGAKSRIKITNSGGITATAGAGNGYGIRAQTQGANSRISIANSGEITVSSKNNAFGINVQAQGPNSPVNINNSGDIAVSSKNNTYGGPMMQYNAFGIGVFVNDGNPVNINNSGDITARGATNNVGIFAYNFTGNGSPIDIVNSGDIMVEGGRSGGGIVTLAPSSSVRINNSGSIFAQGATRAIGIYSKSGAGTTIINSGDISSSSQLAIAVYSGPVDIFNTGTITGFVNLDADDRFINQAGGVFEARQTSDFDANGMGGNDLFINQSGGTVHTAGNANVAETTSFVNLETFQNQGLISMVDGGVGDVFTISNTPGGKDLNFSGSGGSTLAVDAFLGGPGSTADNFVVQGNVSGSTTVAVNNTNTGPGVFNPVGIPVVFVTGATPTGNEFSLAKPIDTGFFDYDLFFTPTGSGHWDLMSYPGAGAHLLPQLVTAAQDIWHQGSSTWFDRTADLRVLLAGGPAPAAYDPGGKSLSAPAPDNFTPAVWMRGSGGWLDRDDSASTTAYGRTYNFNLDRELETIDFQMGIDFGKKDFFSQGDALVFGLLGGFVHGDLDYDNIARSFNFDGGQVGAYATYLNGGLFVDTLFNAHLYSLDTDTLGFPSSLDANTLGLRSDAGYRFGSFSGGPFLEPLATLEVTWADIDGFSLGGNTVTFDDAANVRGRVGARAGTTMQAWEGTMMEPFVIGSLWGNFTDDNQATLVSTGRTFRYQDNLDDVWGEISGGVNFFNFSQTTAVFAKVDVTFGDDVSGVGGKAGMRVAW